MTCSIRVATGADTPPSYPTTLDAALDIRSNDLLMANEAEDIMAAREAMRSLVAAKKALIALEDQWAAEIEQRRQAFIASAIADVFGDAP